MKQLLCGAADRISTPELGLEIPGYFGPRFANGVKSDLYTQAVVLDDGAVIGAGDHAHLMANCDEYRSIAETQMGDGKEVS